MTYKQLDYISCESKCRILASLLEQPWAMLLDSGKLADHELTNKAGSYRQFDIFTFAPTVKLTYQDNHLQVSSNGKISIVDSNPLEYLRMLLQQYDQKKHSDTSKDTPFNGGLLGYMSYDFGKELLAAHPLRSIGNDEIGAVDDLNIPYLKMGLYQWALITDHHSQTSRLYNFGLNETDWNKITKKFEVLNDVTATSSEPPSSLNVSQFKSNTSFKQYSDAFNRIKNYIHSGDSYQVNYAQRFSANYQGSAFPIYERLAKENNSPFSAYLNFVDYQVLSLSPERFIRVRDRQVLTQPIKGTLPRSDNIKEDFALGEQLKNSEKDKAENLMIVDLLRNDLSRTAAKGSVKVTELFGHYKFESVHHLISTVESKIAPDCDNFDLLATSLPGGSITGAPKIRAMQIIDELEPVKRGIYCGIIGYIDFSGNMDTNICIRTLVSKNQILYCWAGGGLVSDSQLEQEYQETFDKLNKILPILNSASPTAEESAKNSLNIGKDCG